MFSSYSLEDKSGTSYSNPKLNLKKSRLGCQRCKARRVKCDEAKPKCKNCKRHGAQCIYVDPQPSRRLPKKLRSVVDHEDSHEHDSHEYRAPISSSSSSGGEGLSKSRGDSEEPPESAERRLLEARLMSHFIRKTAPTMGLDEFPRSVFVDSVPEMCFENKAMLYAIYCIAASDESRLHPENWDTATEISQRYLHMTLRHHQADLANITPENIDAVCLTSVMLRGYAFGLLQYRDKGRQQPYKPPNDWLMFSRTTVSLYGQAYQMTKPDSIAHRYLEYGMSFRPPRDNRAEFGYLLQRNPIDLETEQWDDEMQEAYEWAVCFFGDVKAAVDAKMEEGQILRRLVIFPMMMPERLVELIRQSESRALAVLAHHFAFLAAFEHVWWIGRSGKLEVRAIAGRLTGRWRSVMEWPVREVERLESERLSRSTAV